MSEEVKKELEAGDCGYHPERDEYYYLKKTDKPNTFELYTHSDNRGFEVASPRFIDKNSPFYNKLKLATKNAVPHFKGLHEKVEYIEIPHEVYTKPEDLKRINDELNQKAIDGKLIGIRKEKKMLQFAEPQINGIWTMYLNDKGYIEKIVLF